MEWQSNYNLFSLPRENDGYFNRLHLQMEKAIK